MATIKDVAELAGVSTTAVSRVLNQDPTFTLPDETRQNIFEAAKKLNYIKKQKKNKNTYTMGVLQWYSMQQELEDPFYLSIRMGVERFCEKNNIHIVRVFKSDSNYQDNLKNVDGLICIGKFSDEEMNYLYGITKKIIFLDMKTERIHYSTISLDFDSAIDDALKYLIALHHQKIGYLGGYEYLTPSQKYPDYRYIAFEKYCQKYNIDYQDYVYIDKFSRESGYSMMQDMIRHQKLPTAIVAASDPIAIGAMRALKEHHLRVPEDISIIGFDDIEDANYTNPPLTSMHTPTYHMGEYGARLVYTLLNDKSAIPIQVILPCLLMERESCQEL